MEEIKSSRFDTIQKQKIYLYLICILSNFQLLNKNINSIVQEL